MFGLQSLTALIGISVVSFAAGGFIIGWKSEGRTIIERFDYDGRSRIVAPFREGLDGDD